MSMVETDGNQQMTSCSRKNKTENIQILTSNMEENEELGPSSTYNLDIIREKFLLEFAVGNESIFGYIDGEENYEQFMIALNSIGYSYSVRRSNAPRNNPEAVHTSCIVAGESLSFFYPFKVEKTSFFQCSKGEKYYKARSSGESDDDTTKPTNQPPEKKRRSNAGETQKIGCPAKLIVKRLRMFPEYETKYTHSKKTLNKLKNDIQSGKEVKSFIRHLIVMSDPSNHNHGTTAVSTKMKIHPALVEKINELMTQNVLSVREMKQHLQEFVKKMFESIPVKPDQSNSAFYPKDKIIYNHMCRERFRMKWSQLDQELIRNILKHWQEEFATDKFVFREYSESENESHKQSFLYCHQTPWQVHMIERYGDICILDAVYSTINCCIPLFFLVVKTNVGYIVAGTFVVQTGCKESIVEALRIFQEWNINWKPKYFLTSSFESEISAVESVFLDAKVYICSFFRDQTWGEWLDMEENAVSEPDKMLSFWKLLANSVSKKDYDAQLEVMMNSVVWKKNRQAQYYFRKMWEPVKEKWVLAFHDPECWVTVRINNGMETQDVMLQHENLVCISGSTLSKMLETIVKEYLPEAISLYHGRNSVVQVEHQGSNLKVLQCLDKQPEHFVRHVMDRCSQAQSQYVVTFSDNVFSVANSDGSNSHVVDFTKACCSCEDFEKWYFPCKHMCAVFLYVEGHSFDDLPDAYKNSPFLMLDTHFCEVTEVVHLQEPSDAPVNGQNCVVICNDENNGVKALQEECCTELKYIIDYAENCESKIFLENLLSVVRKISSKVRECSGNKENLSCEPTNEAEGSEVIYIF